MKDLAPIALFTYNRLSETKQTVLALQQNYLAKNSVLYVFSDGGKNKEDCSRVNEVRLYLRSIEGFKETILFEAKENRGLAQSILSGVSKIIDKHGRIIVLEDDLITSPNFLDYMNQALKFYENYQKVISISGYTLNLATLHTYNKDYYIGYRASSWGWATWIDRWNEVDWEVKDYPKFKRDFKKRFEFYKIGSDMPTMLDNQINGKIDSWAIRWCYHQFKNDLWTIFPSISKLNSIGIGSDATHTSGVTRFRTPLDDGRKRLFSFDTILSPDKRLIRDFRSKFSIRQRIYHKIKRMVRNFKL